uniref:Uncharacterized protein n=1 Tax=Sus scrofa TaxID=9823 RepID=A0A8D1AGD8_PIG
SRLSSCPVLLLPVFISWFSFCTTAPPPPHRLWLRPQHVEILGTSILEPQEKRADKQIKCSKVLVTEQESFRTAIFSFFFFITSNKGEKKSIFVVVIKQPKGPSIHVDFFGQISRIYIPTNSTQKPTCLPCLEKTGGEERKYSHHPPPEPQQRGIRAAVNLPKSRKTSPNATPPNPSSPRVSQSAGQNPLETVLQEALVYRKFSRSLFFSSKFFSFSFFFCIFVFLGPHPNFRDAPMAYESSQILNPLSKARDRTHNLMVPSRTHFRYARMGTPKTYFGFVNARMTVQDPSQKDLSLCEGKKQRKLLTEVEFWPMGFHFSFRREHTHAVRGSKPERQPPASRASSSGHFPPKGGSGWETGTGADEDLLERLELGSMDVSRGKFLGLHPWHISWQHQIPNELCPTSFQCADLISEGRRVSSACLLPAGCSHTHSSSSSFQGKAGIWDQWKIFNGIGGMGADIRCVKDLAKRQKIKRQKKSKTEGGVPVMARRKRIQRLLAEARRGPR